MTVADLILKGASILAMLIVGVGGATIIASGGRFFSMLMGFLIICGMIFFINGVIYPRETMDMIGSVLDYKVF